jgi:polar amino acid transport system permease protein
MTAGLGTEAVTPTPIVEQVAAARRVARTRWRLIFGAVWVALVVIIGGGMWLASGADFDFVVRSGPVIVLQGAGATILVSAVSITLATILAIFGALSRLSTNPVLNAIGSFYVS